MDFNIVSIGKDTVILQNKANRELCEVVKSQDILDLCNQESEFLPGSSTENLSCITTPISVSGASKTTWSDVATQKLIELYKENQLKFKSSAIRNESVWKIISLEMVNNGFSFTSKQCDFKWKHLRRLYMKVIDNMGTKGSGEAPEHFKYFEEIDAIFSDRPNVRPVALASSSKGASVAQHKNVGNDEEPKKKKLKKHDEMSDLIAFLEEKENKKEEGRNKRHQEKIKLMQEFMAQWKDVTASSKCNENV